MSNHRTPPVSPNRRTTQPNKRNLSGAFDPNFSLTQAVNSMQLSDPSGPTRSTNRIRATWGHLSGGWPNWTTSVRITGQPAVPTNFTLRMQPRILDCTKALNITPTQAAFNDACTYIQDIRTLVGRAATTDNLDKALSEDMELAVVGSNMIEHVGCGLKETVRLCGEVFLDQRDIFESLEPRQASFLPLPYQRRLETLIRKGQTSADRINDRREVVNHATAFIYITSAIVKRDEPFTEELIKRIHAILCRDVDAQGPGGTSSRQYAGKYRTQHVSADNTNFVSPNFVPRTLAKFIQDLNEDLVQAEVTQELDPFYHAAKASSEFVNIHPFLDGNGRTSRLILNAILLRYAGCIASIGEHDHERRDYMDIMRRTSAEQTGPGEFTAFTLARAKSTLRRMRDRLRRD